MPGPGRGLSGARTMATLVSTAASISRWADLLYFRRKCLQLSCQITYWSADMTVDKTFDSYITLSGKGCSVKISYMPKHSQNSQLSGSASILHCNISADEQLLLNMQASCSGHMTTGTLLRVLSSAQIHL